MQYLCLFVDLERYGLRPYHVTTVRSALDALRQWRFDVVVLDADSFGDGIGGMLALLRETLVPIVVSSSPIDEETQFLRLQEGATAVFPRLQPMRLTALRLRKLAELRRQEATDMPAEVRVGPLLIDTRRVRASVDDMPLELSSRQFEILLLLATRPGEFVHRRDFSGGSRPPGEERSRSVDMQVCRIRSKLRQAGSSGLLIQTMHGLGYCLSYRFEPAPALTARAPQWQASMAATPGHEL